MDVCRVCLVEEADVFHSLFSRLEEVLIAEMINSITGLEITKGDGLPRFICKECSEDILKCYKVRRKCLNSDQELRSTLEKNREKLKMVEFYLRKEFLKETGTADTVNQNKSVEIPLDVIKNVAVNDKLMNILNSHEQTDEECPENVPSDAIVPSSVHLGPTEEVTIIEAPEKFTIKEELDLVVPVDEPREGQTGCTEEGTNDAGQFIEESVSNEVAQVEESVMNGDFDAPQSPTEEEFEYTEEYLETAGEVVEEVQYTIETDEGEELMIIQKLDASSSKKDNEGNIICCGCDTRFYTNEALKQHSIDEHEKMRIKNSAKPFECHICFKRFLSEQRLTLHQTYAYREKNHICENCMARFTCRGSLLNHMKTHAERTYTCEMCKKSFYTSSTLQSHRLLHSDSKQFQCTEPNCSKSFLRKSDLHIHLVSHSNERPFVCDICSSRFKSKAHLVHHGKVHTREKPYKCNKCEKAFGTYSARNVHQLAHDGIHPYKCQFCDKIYQRNTKLQVHVRRIHTGERPFACDLCKDARFYQNWELTAHKKKEHLVESASERAIMSAEEGCSSPELKPKMIKASPKV